MKQQLLLKQTLKLSMTPKLQQAIRLLQLSTQSLELEIQSLLDKNPVIEKVPEPDLDFNVNEFNTSSRMQPEDYQDWLINREKTATLQEHLLWQLMIGSFSEKERLIGHLIIEDINEEGYLSNSLEEVLSAFHSHYPEQDKTDLNEIESLLSRIQTFEPTGVGARTLIECLGIQLNNLPPKTPGLKLALDALPYLDLIGKRDYQTLQKKLGITEPALKTMLKLLKSLNPKPGAQFGPQKSEYAIPDLIVRKKNDRFVVELNMRTVPKLRLNPDYIHLMNRAGTSQSAALLKEHFLEAKHFLKSLEIRNQTLLKVAEKIVGHQQAFFQLGEQALKPLILQTISNACHLHESTISRITTEKYLACTKGLFELKYFFSNFVCHHPDSEEQAYSNKAIQAWVKNLILAESGTMPLSDAKIAGILLKEGIHISRRTVTKYREKLKIPSSQERRKLKNLSQNLQ